jgi:hypothetical protein
LITTGIAFNFIIIRATASRDQQFTQFDTQATVPEFNVATESTPFGSINTILEHESRSERDAELTTVKTDPEQCPTS